MIRLLPTAARWALAATVTLLAAGLLGWAPVYAAPALNTSLPRLASISVALACIAGVGRRTPARGWRPLLVATVGAFALLALVVVARGPGGLRAQLETPRGMVGELPRGPIDLIGADLDAFPHSRKWTIRWKGELRVPETGTYRLWAKGRGDVDVSIDGQLVLSASGESFEHAEDQRIGHGPHILEVTYERTGPGPRLLLEWSPPGRQGGPPGEASVAISPRLLGPERPFWFATDTLAALCAVLMGAIAFAFPWGARARPPAPTPVTRSDWLTALAGYALLAILMSWPIATDPAHLGVVNRPDGRLNAWILGWDVHALVHSPGRLFQAPAFHPMPDALAFSENLLGAAVLAAPALLLGGPVLGYNSAWLFSLAVSGLGVNLLVRRVSGDSRAAFLAGALFAVGAHRWVNTAHLHAHATLFLPFALLAVDSFRTSPTWLRGFSIGAAIALQGVTSVYLGAITAIAVAIALLLTAMGGMGWHSLRRAIPGLLAAGVVLAPIAHPYFRMREFQGQEFDLATLRAASATPESWAASGAWPYFELTRRHLDPARVREPLFPGLVLLVAGLAGLAAAPRRYKTAFVALSAAAVVLSLGPATPIYLWLHEHVILFRGIRALSRFAVLPLLGLCVLTGLAVAGRRRAPFLLLALGLVEACNVPLPHGRYDGPTGATRWLANRTGAVVYLPLGLGDTQAMLEGLVHRRPLVNGDSGFIPRAYTREMELLNAPLGEEALRLLRAVNVRHIVARRDLPLPQRARFGEERVYEVTTGDAAQAAEPASEYPTLWTSRETIVDLGAPSDVSRVTFELSDLEWVPEPLIRASLDGQMWEDVSATASLADATLALLRDPRQARGEIRFAPRRVRFLALDSRLPLRGVTLRVAP